MRRRSAAFQSSLAISANAITAPVRAETVSALGPISAKVAQTAILDENSETILVPKSEAEAAFRQTIVATAHCHGKPLNTQLPNAKPAKPMGTTTAIKSRP